MVAEATTTTTEFFATNIPSRKRGGVSTEKEEKEYNMTLEEFETTSAGERLSRSPMRTACISYVLFPPSHPIPSPMRKPGSTDNEEHLRPRHQTATIDPRRVPSSRIHYNSAPADTSIRAAEEGVTSIANRSRTSSIGSSSREAFDQEHSLHTHSELDDSSQAQNKSRDAEIGIISPPRIHGTSDEASFLPGFEEDDDDDDDSLIGDYAFPGRVRENAEDTNAEVVSAGHGIGTDGSFFPRLSNAYDEIFSRFGLTPDKNEAFGQSTHMPHPDASPGRTSRLSDTQDGSNFEEEGEITPRRIPRGGKNRNNQNSKLTTAITWTDSDETEEQSSSFLSTKIGGVIRLDFLLVLLAAVITVSMLAAVMVSLLNN